MKKQYNKPSMKVVKLKKAPAILAGSGYDDEINAPRFRFPADEE